MSRYLNSLLEEWPCDVIDAGLLRLVMDATGYAAQDAFIDLHAESEAHDVDHTVDEELAQMRFVFSLASAGLNVAMENAPAVDTALGLTRFRDTLACEAEKHPAASILGWVPPHPRGHARSKWEARVDRLTRIVALN